MSSGLKVTKDNMEGFQKSLAQLVKSRVLVGVPATTAERDPDPDEKAPINNAELAYLQNYGSPSQNIPARPFMEPGIDDAKDKIAKVYAKGAQDVISDPSTDVNITHEKVGLIAQVAIQNRITEGNFTPLADSTIAARQAKGITSDKPLTVTGQMNRAITYVVRQKS